MREANTPTFSTQKKSLIERGIRIITLQYYMLDRATGGLNHRQATIPTNLPILPAFKPLYADTTRRGPLMRKRIDASGEANFVLIDREYRVIGYVCLNTHDLSDRDFAWLNCMFEESEGAVLALFDEILRGPGRTAPAEGKENAVPVMIDTGLIVGDIFFHERHDRMVYINTLNADRQRWLEEWQCVEDH